MEAPNNNLYTKIISDKAFRKQLVKQSHYYFFHFYFSNYISYPTADFQKEIFQLTENDSQNLIVIVAFRGCAKSTIVTLSNVIWSILCRDKKFVLLVGRTQEQSRLMLSNIKRELDNNKLLLSDFGPFAEESDEWRSNSLVFPRFNARITAVSTGESIRGLRHLQYRPDLIICDDIEDIESTKTIEGRDKTFTWFKGELLPAGDKHTKVIVVGNLLHEDSLIMRLRKSIKAKKTDGVFKAYPVVNRDNIILWPGKYPRSEDIEKEHKKIASESDWFREYLLKIIAKDGQIVDPKWIKYYDKIFENLDRRLIGDNEIIVGVDLAISKSDKADYTAIVPIRAISYDETYFIYVLTPIINKRLNFPEAVETIKIVSKQFMGGYTSKIVIENVGYQKAMIDQLKLEEGMEIEEFTNNRLNKAERLTLVTPLIKKGQILFPKEGAEKLVQQLIGFETEKHDDLVDAFSSAILTAIKIVNTPAPGIYFI